MYGTEWLVTLHLAPPAVHTKFEQLRTFFTSYARLLGFFSASRTACSSLQSFYHSGAMANGSVPLFSDPVEVSTGKLI